MKKFNITNKLDMDTRAIIVIGEKELEIKTDAKTALLLMEKLRNGANTKDEISELRDLIFTEESAAKLEEMNISYKDYKTVISEAISIINGEATEGEDQTHTTV